MLFLWVTVWASATSLEVVGTCPGAVEITVFDITPGAAVGLIGGAVVGETALAGAPCPGLVVGVEEHRLLTTEADVDVDGIIVFRKIVRAEHCGMPIQVVNASVCDTSEVVPLLGEEAIPDDCPTDWLLETPCLGGIDFGGGCTDEETGYHFEGIFSSDTVDYACWWHTKNQAWNVSTETNFSSLADAFSLTSEGGSTWCHSLASDPCESGTCVVGGGGYFDAGDVGAWGWCGGDPFISGGHVCMPIDPDRAERCR